MNFVQAESRHILANEANKRQLDPFRYQHQLGIRCIDEKSATWAVQRRWITGCCHSRDWQRFRSSFVVFKHGEIFYASVLGCVINTKRRCWLRWFFSIKYFAGIIHGRATKGDDLSFRTTTFWKSQEFLIVQFERFNTSESTYSQRAFAWLSFDFRLANISAIWN